MSRLGLTKKDIDSAVINGTCEWTEDDDGIWTTSCHTMHTFFDGGPAENFYKYCPYCGKFITVQKYKEALVSEVAEEVVRGIAEPMMNKVRKETAKIYAQFLAEGRRKR